MIRGILGSLQEVGGLLVKRGTAMGPLVPALMLCPVLLLFAWLFRSTFVVSGCPIISTGLAILSVGIVIFYLFHYASFAQSDPDRLQSEEYRYETARMQMIAAKQFPYPIPAENLSLDDPRENPAVPDAAAEEDAPPALTDADEEKLS